MQESFVYVEINNLCSNPGSVWEYLIPAWKPKPVWESIFPKGILCGNHWSANKIMIFAGSFGLYRTMYLKCVGMDFVRRSRSPTSQWEVLGLLLSLICVVQNDKEGLILVIPFWWLSLDPSPSSCSHRPLPQESITKTHTTHPLLRVEKARGGTAASSAVTIANNNVCLCVPAHSDTNSISLVIMTTSAFNLQSVTAHIMRLPLPCLSAAMLLRGGVVASSSAWMFDVFSFPLLDKLKPRKCKQPPHKWTLNRQEKDGKFQFRTERTVWWRHDHNPSTQAFSSCLDNVLTTQKSSSVVSNCWLMLVFCGDTTIQMCGDGAAEFVSVCVSSVYLTVCHLLRLPKCRFMPRLIISMSSRSDKTDMTCAVITLQRQTAALQPCVEHVTAVWESGGSARCCWVLAQCCHSAVYIFSSLELTGSLGFSGETSINFLF